MLLLLVPVGATPVAAQQLDETARRLPERVDTLRVMGPGPFLIRPFLELPLTSLTVNGKAADEEHLDIQAVEGLLTLKDVAPDSLLEIVVHYRYVPWRVVREWVAWPQAADTVQYARRPGTPERSGQRLVTRGTVSRGVSAGTGRDARVESGLRLQVAGNLTPGIRLDAALTDEDTPLVPEGVTRQLDQFDRIRIGVEGGMGRVELGDFDARLLGTRYARLNRRLQGAGVTSNHLKLPMGKMRFAGGAAISRGIFRNMALPIQDGVQGPYRLTGDGGERFILIIPGTERVYLNGDLLVPGPDSDYVLDHTTAELTFMARRMVRAGQRVTVEFEYTTQRFTRTMSFAEATGAWISNTGRPLMEWGIASIREADGEAFSDELGLSAADSMAIALSSGGTVRVDGATRVPFDPLATYTQYFRDTDGDGRIFFREVDRQPARDEAVYRVVFSWVGSGLGTYERVAGLSGNVAYQFRGEGGGAYSPERTLPVPVSRTLSAVRMQSQALPLLKLDVDWAYSSIDQNRMSSAPGTLLSDQAWGVDVSTVPAGLGADWVWFLDGRASGRGASFETFERVRDVDFLRQWNLPIAATSTTGALVKGQQERTERLRAHVAGPDSTGLMAAWQRLTLGTAIEAERFDGRIRLAPFSTWEIKAHAQRVQSAGSFPDVFATNRTLLDARLAWQPVSANWRPWVEWERERYDGIDPSGPDANIIDRRIPVDAVRVGLERTVGFWTGGVQVEDRKERGRIGSAIIPNAYRTWQGQVAWQPDNGWRSSLTGGIRARESVSIPQQGNKTLDRSLVLSWLGQGSPSRGHRVRWGYDVRAERTAAQQEIFLRTGSERGQYVWVDGNADGVIQEDEFLPESLPGEGEYARVLFPTDSLEAVTTAAVSLGYDHEPQRDTPAWMRISLRSHMEISETSRSGDRTAIALLQRRQLRVPGQTVNGRFRFSQQVGLAPHNPRRDVDLGFVRVRSLAEMASGVQEQRLDESTLRWREAASNLWDVTTEVRNATHASSSSRFSSRTYRIRRTEWQPGLVFKPGKWRVQGRWVRATATESASDTRASIHRIPMDVFWGASRWSWRAGLEWATTDVSGGQAVGLQLFELAEGRGVGMSWLWNVRLDARLTEVVTATFRYDGRNPEQGRAIHTGSFQLSARF